MLLELSPLTEIPRPYGVVQTTRPQLCTIGGNIDTACSVSVTLKLSTMSINNFVSLLQTDNHFTIRAHLKRLI